MPKINLEDKPTKIDLSKFKAPDYIHHPTYWSNHNVREVRELAEKYNKLVEYLEEVLVNE